MKSGIRVRWRKNILLLTAIVIFAACTMIIYLLVNKYYNIVESTVEFNNHMIIDTYFKNINIHDNNEFKKAAYNFLDYGKAEETKDIWVIDKNGVPIASSSGYDVSQYTEMPDYKEALNSEDGSYTMKTSMPWGEPVMASTYILCDSNGIVFGAVRSIISLQDVNHQLIFLSFFVYGVFLLLVMIMSNSGSYFVSTIVEPVNQISETAKKIAEGDLSARIDVQKFNDEISSLCSNINEMAEKLGETDRIKNEFISTVSHEIRTPLTAIKGWGETLISLDTCNDEIITKGLNVILSETTRLSSMVEELLDFSRIQNGKFHIKEGVVDIIAEVNQAFLIYASKAQNENKEIILEYDEKESFIVDGDSDRICQVFVNILDNAVKYSSAGGKIKVSVAKNKKYVKITFQDNGVGIKSNDLVHIKEKFFKANNEVRGTGIGLAVVDEIVKAHGGTLNIESVVNEGTKVEVCFVLKSEEE
ncbi:MAG: HAMP domain-containing histidine kinase [Clostridia bacterium]|nr:HAMP domain-containing histidine kinase [Clostridia bacterium]